MNSHTYTKVDENDELAEIEQIINGEHTLDQNTLFATNESSFSPVSVKEDRTRLLADQDELLEESFGGQSSFVSLSNDSPLSPPILSTEDDNDHHSSSSSNGTRRQPLITQNDGVFANLAAKPEGPNAVKNFEEIEPPSYDEIVQDPSPPYFDTTNIISGVSEDGELLIEGFPVGNFVIFLVNAFVSMSFDFLGFLLTTLLATSHAARFGSQAGFGLTMIRYGVLLKDPNAADWDPEFVHETGEQKQRREWTAFFLIIFGFFILCRANGEFIRFKRMQDVILSSSPLTNV